MNENENVIHQQDSKSPAAMCLICQDPEGMSDPVRLHCHSWHGSALHARCCTCHDWHPTLRSITH